MISADPRATMRDALRRLMRSDPPAWDEDSLRRFRNRLLDETGSDARPLAELLLEAIRRGWRDQLPQEPLSSEHWETLSAAFVLRWSAERFLQPEMARWAAESWGYALEVIRVEQLRVALPQNAAPVARVAIAPTPATGSPLPPPVAAPPVAAPPVRRSATPTRVAPPRPLPRAMPLPRPASPSTSAGMPALSPRVAYVIAGCAAASYVFFIGRMMVSVTLDRRSVEAPVVSRDSAAASLAVPPVVARADTGAAPAPVSRPTVDAAALVRAAPIRADSPRTETSRVEPSRTATLSANAPNAPNAPGAPLPSAVTAPRTDASRMLLVEPVRRANGASLPATSTSLAPAARAPTTFDELQLNDGSRMVGRVDIVRSGSLVFRDMRTGLRHEVRKDDIAQIITEFGTTVRFRAIAAAPGNANDPATSRRGNTAAAVASVRSSGVAGRYLIRYGKVTPVGSPECAAVWTRPPNAEDRLSVRHLPNADTLVVAFDGGENYPGNVDADGFFASTPRILPDQARTSTALVTRLSGRFDAGGSLSLTVSIVFFRRMRVGPDVSCTVTVDASGRRTD